MSRLNWKQIASGAAVSLLLASTALAQTPEEIAEELQVKNGGLFVQTLEGETLSCRHAVKSETTRFFAEPAVPLHVIYPTAKTPRANNAGLKVILRGTQQIEQFPEAKAAFIRAAQTYERMISTPMTVYLDVDYGPTRFGSPWDDASVIGSTNSDARGTTVAQVKTALLATQSGGAENALYAALPTPAVPSDIGQISAVATASTQLRALGILPSADPGTGNTPDIGFNSNFPFDFNPGNGIDADKMDFDAIAVHEMGHAFGFSSRVGYTELSGGFSAAFSILDLFRLRPGTGSNFATAQRVLSSGGTQIFFRSTTQELGLSTGRPNGEGGDRQQASHWKSSSLTGTYIGLMNPTIGFGQRRQLTENDRLAFDQIGYTLHPATGCSESEPNQGFTTAEAFIVPGSCSGSVADTDGGAEVTIGGDAVEDLYEIALTTPLRVSVSLNFPNGGGNADLYVIDENRNLLASATSSAPTSENLETPVLQPGVYYVGVSSRGGNVNYEISATASIGPALAPLSLSGSADGFTQAALHWNDVADNEEAFVIYMSTDGGSGFTYVGTAPRNATTAVVNDLQPSRTYHFRVTARNQNGETAPSNVAAVVMPAAPPTMADLRFRPLTPCRVLDTREGSGGRLLSHQTRTFKLTGVAPCNVSATAKAVSVNITVTNNTTGYLSVWPAGGQMPVVSTINFQADGPYALANAAIIPLGTNGSINIFPEGSTDVIIDINGYFD